MNVTVMVTWVNVEVTRNFVNLRCERRAICIPPRDSGEGA
jgi:hypothetical protein